MQQFTKHNEQLQKDYSVILPEVDEINEVPTHFDSRFQVLTC